MTTVSETNQKQLSPLKRAFIALEQMQAKLETLERRQNEPIAVIGMGCRFPGANDIDSFWELLHNGIDAITEVPSNRWDIDAYYDPNPGTPNKMYLRTGGFVDNVDQFDPDFFSISPREAMRMDPQQRLLLEIVWQAFENAGMVPAKLAGSKTGVFIGISNNDYSTLQYNSQEVIDAYHGTGNAFSIAANRISYLFDLRGPSVAVDTACSSSLVSVHLAMQSLRAGEANLALAGGVNLILTPEANLIFSHARMMSFEGRCKTFDASADGYVRGEGCGIIILKRLTDALKDRDRILAVIRGSAINQDGRSNGITAPNGLAQQEVIKEALKNAKISSDQIAYIEAHGTGTILGDPIEVQSLGAVMKDRPKNKPCLIGSVKTNIGHLESAAGIAGLIKVVLALRHEEIPPHLHFKQINPHIPIHELPLEIPVERRPWKSGGEKRFAAVSSFGFGGTNSHIVLEEAPMRKQAHNEIERPLHLLAISAKTETALNELIKKYVSHLAENKPDSLADICFSANTGRSHFSHRLAIAGETVEQMRERLVALADGQPVFEANRGEGRAKKRSKITFLFTGQGSQHIGMGRMLYETQPTFRNALDRCDRILRAYLDKPLLSVIYPANADSELIHATAYTQPALFSIEYALAQLWRSWGIEPNFVIGHSVGEYVAACIAGVFSLEDGLKLIATRGKLMNSLPNDGDMAVIFADRNKVLEAIQNYQTEISIAGENGPNNIVISGKRASVHTIVAMLQAEGIETRSLTVSHAFHSPLMEPILDEFEKVSNEVHYQAPEFPIVSNLTGKLIDSKSLPDAKYWRQHIREAVKFYSGMQTLAEQGCEIFIEIGPNPVMIGMGRRCLPDIKGLWLTSLKQDSNDWQEVLNSLAALYVNGVDVDWAGFDRDYHRALVSLPYYSFQHDRYWVEGSLPGRRGIHRAVQEKVPVDPVQFQVEIARAQTPDETENYELTRQSILDADPDQRLALLQSYLKKEIAQVMGLNINRIDVKQPVNNLGLDSIMAIELKNKIEKKLEVDYPIASLLEGPNIIQISQHVSVQMTASESATAKIIPAGEKVSEYPLSYGQRAMWFQHQMAPESIYNLIYAVRIRSQVDVSILKQAFQTLIDRHPTLRSTFHAEKGEPVQKVHDTIEVDFLHEDASAWSDDQLQHRIAEETRQQFDLENGPLFRIHLFSKSDNDHILLETIHHIVADLWSQAIIANEVGILYSALVSHKKPALPKIDIQYSDYVRWHSEMLQSAEGEKLWQYWREKLSGDLSVLNLPTDRPRPAVQTFKGMSKSVEFKPELTRQLKKISEQHGATMYMTLLAAFNVMLHRYSGQDDLIIGTPTTGRSRNELAPLVGYFVNPLPIRSDLSGNPKFTDFLGQVRQTVVDAIDHQAYPFGLLVEKLHPKRDTSRTPLFQVMFVFQRAHLLYEEGLSAFAISSEGEQMDLGGLPLEAFKLEEWLSPFDFTLMMAESKNGLAASLTYNTDLFDSNRIDRMLGHFQTLLESIAINPGLRISELNLLPRAEIDNIKDDLSGNQVSEGAEKCFHELFEKQAEDTPDALAVVFEGNQLTYGELNQKANQLAHYLKKFGVKPDIKVAIFVERSSEMIVEILGVLKAGGAYVPLDPAYPPERLSLMLDDSNASVLIKQSNLALPLPVRDIRVIDIDTEWDNIARESSENPANSTAPDNLAYMIYTSGSTGKPKGTLLPHRGLCNFAAAHVKALDVREPMRMLQFASFSFDASVSEIFTTLMAGGTLYLAQRETILATPRLVELIQEHQINSAILPPSMLAILPVEKLPGLKRIISAGESCPGEVASNWAKDRNFYNGYGPTEATVGPTIYRVDPGKSDVKNIPIGRPLTNIRTYILDKYLQPVPVGIPGELHIGGICLARGYHNRPELTSMKFVPDPFSATPGARMYKTGDLARFLPDGNIEFLGRIDHQVKIRGFRIEMEEIESHLAKHPAVEKVIVMAQQDNSGENKLIAYISKDHKPVPENSEMREFLKAKLPDYMIPSFFVYLESFPLTQSGKIDRKALPQPDELKLSSGATYVKPRTEIEQIIANTWQDVLKLEKVGVYDNFFDLGGHSLAMAKVHGQLCDHLKQEISIVDLFKYPTIYSLSQYFAAEKENQPIFIEKQQRAFQQRKAMDLQRERLAKRRASK